MAQATELDSTRSGALRWNLVGNTLGPFLTLALVVGFFAVADARQENGGNFLSVRNLQTISAQTATVAVAALGMTVIIISGGIDLAAGSTLALAATALAWCLEKDYHASIAVAASLGTGCLAGLVNGTLISSLRVVPFIVTLGTMTIYLGIGKLIADETTIRPDLSRQVPVWLQDLVSTHRDALLWGMPSGVWLALILAFLLSLVLRQSVFGRYVYALGSNEATARLCGINVWANKIALYTLAGLFVGVAGMYQFSRLSSGNPTSGTGLELRIIAAVVIGGGSLSGGRGSVVGTLTGATIMAVFASGCTQLKWNNPIQDIVLGVMIVAAVTLDQIRQRRLAT
ncbi:MAG TPA: ABC transporter permease [Pirellulales bacterium]|nr:ABC transporter permease [Pirellulales bacterium]